MQNTVLRFRSLVKSRDKAFALIFTLNVGISTKLIALTKNEFAQHGCARTLLAYNFGGTPPIN